MEKLRRIERFGLEAITGRRVFLYKEYLWMIAAENIVTACESFKRSSNWAEWSESNPELARIYAEAAKLNADCEW